MVRQTRRRQRLITHNSWQPDRVQNFQFQRKPKPPQNITPLFEPAVQSFDQPPIPPKLTIIPAAPLTPPARFENTMRTAALMTGALVICFSIALAMEQSDFFNTTTSHLAAETSALSQPQIAEATPRNPDEGMQDFETMLKAAADAKEFTGTYQIIDSRTDLEKQIEHKLATTPITVNFVDTPLKEVVRNIGEQLSVAVYLAENHLSEEGIPSDEPINGSFGEPVRAEAAMRILFDKLGLTWYVANDMLIVTTRTAADEFAEVRMYDVRGIGFDTHAEMTRLVNIITTQTGDEFAWDVVGGVGSIGVIPGAVIVRQTPKVHNEIKALLDQFQKFVTPIKSSQQN